MLAWLAVVNNASATLVVDYSNLTAIGANLNLNGTVNTTTGDYDADGSSDDRRALRAFSETTRLSPAAWTQPATVSSLFYGGARAFYFNNTALTGFNRFQVRNVSSPNFPISLTTQANAGQSSALHLVVVWLADNFLSFDPLTQKAALGAGTTLNMTLTADVGVVGEHRWVIKQGGQYYMSQVSYTTTGAKSLTNPSGSTTWALYDPATDLNFDQASAFATVTFDDIQAVGYYVENDMVANQIASRLAPFRADASVAFRTTPAELTVAPVSGMALDSGDTVTASAAAGKDDGKLTAFSVASGLNGAWNVTGMALNDTVPAGGNLVATATLTGLGNLLNGATVNGTFDLTLDKNIVSGATVNGAPAPQSFSYTLDGSVAGNTAPSDTAQTAVVAAAGNFAGLNTTDAAGAGTLAGFVTTVQFLGGVNGVAQKTVSVAYPGAHGGSGGAKSDVTTVTSIDGETYVLQVNYDASLFAGNEGDARLVWWSGGAWVNAIGGNHGAGAPLFVGDGAWAGDTTLGHYGVDTANDRVWAVVNHASDFAAGLPAGGPTVPVLSAPTAAAVETTTATLGATLDSDGGSTILSYGTIWDTTSPATTHVQTDTGAPGAGPFTQDRTGLPSATHVYVRGFAENAVGPGYSSEREFWTEPTAAADVSFSAVTANGLTVAWSVGDGTGRIVVMKQGSAVLGAPADGSDYTANAAFGGGSTLGAGEYVVYKGAGSSVPVTGLARGLTYHVAVFEYAGDGTLRNYQQDAPAIGSQVTLSTAMRFHWDAGGGTDRMWNTVANWYNDTTGVNDSDYPHIAGDRADIYANATDSATMPLGENLTVGRVDWQQKVPQTIGNAGEELTFQTVDGSESRFDFYQASWSDPRTITVNADMALNNDLYFRAFIDRPNGGLKGVVSGPGKLTLDLDYENNGVLTYLLGESGEAVNTHTGGTTVTMYSGDVANFSLVVGKNGAFGTGNLTLNLYARVTLPDIGATDDMIADTASVYMQHSGANYGKLTLNAGVNETVRRLYFDGVQQARGTYGNTGSGADDPQPDWFAGPGLLTVLESPMSVAAVTVAGLDTTEATLGATVVADGQTVTARGTVYGEAADPTGNSAAAGAGDGTFAHLRTGFQAGRPYYVRGWAENAVDGRLYSTNATFFTEPEQDAAIVFSDVQNKRLTISWTKGTAGAGTLVAVRQGNPVAWVPDDGASYDANAAFGTAGTGLPDGSYAVYAGTDASVTVTGLTPGATYHVRLFAFAGTGTLRNYQQDAPPEGSQATTFSQTAPILSSPTVAAIDTTTVTLGATVEDDGLSPITSHGTAWGPAPAPTGNRLAIPGPVAGAFTQPRTGLTPGAHVYARGWAENGVDVGYTPTDVEFYMEPLAASAVQFADVTETTMTVSWTAGGGGGGRLVVLREGAAPSTGPADGIATYAADPAYGAGSALGGGSVVAYGDVASVPVTGLLRGRTYHVAVYEYAGSGGLINYQQDGPAQGSQTMAVLPQIFYYDGARVVAAWDNPLNYVGDSGYPSAPGDSLLIDNAISPQTCRHMEMNGDRTVGTFSKNKNQGDDIAIVPGSVAGSTLTWNTGNPSVEALFKTRYGAGEELRCFTAVNMYLQSSLTWDGSCQDKACNTSTTLGSGNGHITGNIGGPGKLTVKWNRNKYSAQNSRLELRGGAGPNTHEGGTTFLKNELGTRAGFRLNKQWATGLGDTVVAADAELYVASVAAAGGALHDATSLYLDDNGTTHATVELEAGVSDMVAHLFFRNPATGQWEEQAGGSWGSPASAAQHKNATWFGVIGSGELKVVGPPATVFSVR